MAAIVSDKVNNSVEKVEAKVTNLVKKCRELEKRKASATTDLATSKAL